MSKVDPVGHEIIQVTDAMDEQAVTIKATEAMVYDDAAGVSSCCTFCRGDLDNDEINVNAADDKTGGPAAAVSEKKNDVDKAPSKPHETLLAVERAKLHKGPGVFIVYDHLSPTGLIKTYYCKNEEIHPDIQKHVLICKLVETGLTKIPASKYNTSGGVRINARAVKGKHFKICQGIKDAITSAARRHKMNILMDVPIDIPECPEFIESTLITYSDDDGIRILQNNYVNNIPFKCMIYSVKVNNYKEGERFASELAAKADFVKYGGKQLY